MRKTIQNLENEYVNYEIIKVPSQYGKNVYAIKHRPTRTEFHGCRVDRQYFKNLKEAEYYIKRHMQGTTKCRDGSDMWREVAVLQND